ncbi:MAG: ATP-dependent DNA helicase [Clostridia bacterium]|nr:ATP-dependent DNA helicase [Clostridia bacterium]
MEKTFDTASKRKIGLTGERFVSLFAVVKDGGISKSAPDISKALARLISAAKKAGVDYSREPLSLVKETERFVFEIGFSCAGYFEKDGGFTVDSLCPGDFEEPGIFDPTPFFEAKMFAALLCRERNLPGVTLRKIVYDPSCGRMRFFTKNVPASELDAALEAALDKAVRLFGRIYPASGRVKFPFGSLRDGQRQLMEDCFEAIKTRTNLLACAPTGIGKTLSFLYPSLRALEAGRCSRVFFLTPKGSVQRQIAQACDRLSGDGIHRAAVMFSRQSACAAGTPRCIGGACRLWENMSERLFGAAMELAGTPGSLTRERIVSVAAKHAVCPYELALYAASFADVIICDYNFVFDRKAALTSLADSRSVVLTDEAHDLPDRVRDLFSARLDPKLNRLTEQAFTPLTDEEADAVKKIEEHFISNERALDSGADRLSLSPDRDAAKLSKKLMKLIKKRGDFDDAQLDIYMALRAFCAADADFSRGYVRSVSDDGGVSLILADPSEHIREYADSFGTAVFFSATLQPEEYFSKVLGNTAADRFVSYPSPFEPSNLLLIASPLNTSVSHRGASLARLASLVAAACAQNGRYIVFFPSFEYLRSAERLLRLKLPKSRFLVQRSSMNHSERAKFIADLENGGGSTVALCVLGGLFAEGIELENASLDGAVAVGTGMPPPAEEREAAGFYFSHSGLDGKAFSYLLPGFNRVLQAVGRVIRRESDRGFALLLGDRYADGAFSGLYPPHWEEPVLCLKPDEIAARIKAFREG